MAKPSRWKLYLSGLTSSPAEHVRRVQEFRRSTAAQPHRNRKTYTRKRKHRSKEL